MSAMQFNSIVEPMFDDIQFPQEDDLLNFTNSITVPAIIQIPAELLVERLGQLNGKK